jgi:hypothetical protein
MAQAQKLISVFVCLSFLALIFSLYFKYKNWSQVIMYWVSIVDICMNFFSMKKKNDYMSPYPSFTELLFEKIHRVEKRTVLSIINI